MSLKKAEPLTPDDLRGLWKSLSAAEHEAAREDAMFWACEWDANWFDGAAMQDMAAACLEAANNWIWRNAGPEGARRVAAAFVFRADALASRPPEPPIRPTLGAQPAPAKPIDGG